MQRRVAHLEAELWKLKDRLIEAERERDQALDYLEESRKEVDEANAKLSEGFMPRKVPEIYTEVNSLKKLLANTSRELKDKEREIEAMRVDIERGKAVETQLADCSTVVERLRKELEIARIAEERIKSEHGRRVRELEDNMERRKESESRTFDTLATLTKQLEQTKITLEESKLKMNTPRTKKNKDSNAAKSRSKENRQGKDIPQSSVEESAEQNLTRANDEVRKIRVELRLSNAAEENGKKALDDLAVAQKEVAAESNQVKLKLDVTRAELDHSRREETNLKARLQVMDQMSKKLVDELQAENEQLKSTLERLRSEMEDSLVAWTEKEVGFIGCIRAAGDENAIAQQESIRFSELLKAADKMVKSSREENNKLRDILKQALKEASIAKEAASISRTENLQLKDELSEKDDALNFLTQENESLRINEATAAENIRELKRLANESKSQHPNKINEKDRINKHNHKDGKRLGKTFSFHLKERRVHHNNHPKHNKENGSDVVREWINKDDSHEDGDPLRGSIFDVAESHFSPQRHHRRNSSSTLTSNLEMANSEDREHVVDRCRLEGAEGERMSRKKVALLRRFGDLVRRKSNSEKSSPA